MFCHQISLIYWFLAFEKSAFVRLILKPTFQVGKVKFQTFYPGAGHTADNIVVWFPKQKILYGGCFVKSISAKDLGYTGEANVPDWEGSIIKVQKNFKKPKFIIPGHQRWDSLEALNHTLELVQTHLKK